MRRMGEVDNNYKNRSFIVKGIGVLLLFLGMSAAIIGPYEIYAFYLFSKGGSFHYEGFGFGSFMFANIVWQIIGYYAIASICIPLGIGHLRLRKWIIPIMQSLLWVGLIVGIPLIIVFLFMLSVKDLSLIASIIVITLLAFFYLAGQIILIRFYKSQNVRMLLENYDPRSYQIESIPISILVLTFLFIFYVVILHVPLFFNGIYPLFGKWLSGIQGFIAFDISIIILSLLTWGTFKQNYLAWIGSIIYFCILTSSVLITLLLSSKSDILLLMKFPATEMKLLENVPLHGIHFIPFIVIPLLITLIVILLSRRYFNKGISIKH